MTGMPTPATSLLWVNAKILGKIPIRFCNSLVKANRARKKYRDFVDKGIGRERNPEMTGGGLLRSIGGWGVLKIYAKDEDSYIGR